MQEQQITVERFEQILDLIANDPRLPPNFSPWVRASLSTGGWKIRILRYVIEYGAANSSQTCILDVGSQFGSLALYAAKLGCRVAAVDYGPFARNYKEILADYGVNYRECQVGIEPLPFQENSFDFVTYTDVLEHHAFSSRRVLREIYRVLVPGGRLILITPNHASIYNRLKLLVGSSVNDDLDYFFDMCTDDPIYDGHHREYTRSEVRTILQRTQFRVLECSVIEQDLYSLLYYLHRSSAPRKVPSYFRDVLLRTLGVVWTRLKLPFGRWIWAVGQKTARDSDLPY